MTEESGRTRSEPVRARLEHRDQVARVRLRELHAVGEEVERSAERADHGSDFALAALHAVAHDDGIVLADHLAEIARSRQVMVQAAVGHEENLTAGDLAVDHPADVEARL